MKTNRRVLLAVVVLLTVTGIAFGDVVATEETSLGLLPAKRAPGKAVQQATEKPAAAVIEDVNNLPFPKADVADDTGGDTLSTEMIRLVASLAGVLFVIVAAVWAFKRFAPRTASMFSSENLKVLSRTYLGPKQTIYLVKAPSSLLILGATQESINLLTEIRDPVEMERTLGAVESASASSASGAFRSLLSGVTSTEKQDRNMEEQLAVAVKNVSDRFARLNRKLAKMESTSD